MMMIIFAICNLIIGYFFSKSSPQPKFILAIFGVLAAGDLANLVDYTDLSITLKYVVAPVLCGWMYFLRGKYEQRHLDKGK